MLFSLMDPQSHRAAIAASIEATRRWRAMAPRCVATNRLGQPCGGLAMRGTDRCVQHAPATAGRLRKEGKIADTPLKAHRRAMRRAWRRDPWMEGWTVELPLEAEAQLAGWLLIEGLCLDWQAPAVADWLRWRFVQAHRRGDLTDAWTAIVEGLRARMEAAGPPPANIGNDAAGLVALSRTLVPVANLRRKPGSPWVEVRPGRGTMADESARLAAQDKRLTEFGLTDWRPQYGGPLSEWEQRQLRGAREKDAREGRGGHRLEEACRRAIEAWREKQARWPGDLPEQWEVGLIGHACS